MEAGRPWLTPWSQWLSSWKAITPSGSNFKGPWPGLWDWEDWHRGTTLSSGDSQLMWRDLRVCWGPGDSPRVRAR